MKVATNRRALATDTGYLLVVRSTLTLILDITFLRHRQVQCLTLNVHNFTLHSGAAFAFEVSHSLLYVKKGQSLSR